MKQECTRCGRRDEAQRMAPYYLGDDLHHACNDPRCREMARVAMRLWDALPVDVVAAKEAA